MHCFQTKTHKCKYWVLKVLRLKTQMVCYGWLKNDSLCFAFVALAKMLLCCWSMQWIDTWHTKTWSSVTYNWSFATLKATNASCISVNPALTLHLWKNFLIRDSTNMKMMRNLITDSGTLRIEQYWQALQPLTKKTKRLWLMLLII